MHAFQRWFLRNLCAYLGLCERARFLARPRPEGALIARHREPYPEDFTARGGTLAWAADLVATLQAENILYYGHAVTLLTDVLHNIKCGQWARYGYASGDMGQSTLDECNRVRGSDLNRKWTEAMEWLEPRLVPNQAYVHACARVVLLIDNATTQKNMPLQEKHARARHPTP